LISFPGLFAVYTRVGIGNNVKMTTDSQFDERSHLQFHSELLYGNDKHTNESTGAMDMVKRDRFELLSAYLDGEVTSAERRQVEEWLANDPTIQRLYQRLLKLRQGLRSIPMPQPKQGLEETVKQVLARSRQRSRMAVLYASGTVAACVIAAMAGLLSNSESKAPQLAQRQSPQPAQQIQSSPPPVLISPLMIAINSSVVPIPKAAEAIDELSPATKENKVERVESLPQQDLEKNIN
jgi:tellurite resistance protein